MPPEGVEWKPHGSIISFEQILRITEITARLGIKKIRITGGEPLLRRGVSAFMKNLKAIPGIESLTLTTNGLLLQSYLDEAGQSGMDPLPDGMNISFNALNKDRYRLITRCGNTEPPDIIAIIDRLLEKKINVKVNCVPLRTVNDDEIIPITFLAKDRNITVRFIELMPIGTAALYQFVSGKEIKNMIEKEFGSLTHQNDKPYASSVNGPAVNYSLVDFKGKIGFINAMTHGFCETCNRLRLTSEGFLKLCLSNDLGLDLKQLLVSGASDDDISLSIIKAVYNKPRFHTLSDYYVPQENHPEGMYKIGG